MRVGQGRCSCFVRGGVLLKRRGFTLLELLVVVSVIIILSGLLIPAFYKVRNGAREKQAQIEARVIGAAIAAYKLQERHLPAPDSDLSAGEDVTYTEDNDRVMALLRESDPQVLDENKLRWDGNVVLDPWENPYTITLDLDGDGFAGAGGAAGDYKVKVE